MMGRTSHTVKPTESPVPRVRQALAIALAASLAALLAAATPANAQEMMLGAGALVPLGTFADRAATGLGFDLVIRSAKNVGGYGIRTDLTFDRWSGVGAITRHVLDAQTVSVIRDLSETVYCWTGIGSYIGFETQKSATGTSSNTRQHQTMGVQGGIGLRYEKWWGKPFAEVGVVKVFGPKATAVAYVPIRAGLTLPPFVARILGGGGGQ